MSTKHKRQRRRRQRRHLRRCYQVPQARRKCFLKKQAISGDVGLVRLQGERRLGFSPLSLPRRRTESFEGEEVRRIDLQVHHGSLSLRSTGQD